MFKYVRFEIVQTDDTVLEFRGGTEEVQVNVIGSVASIKAENESDIDALVNSQDDRINCEYISKEDFKTATMNSKRVQRINERVEEKYNKDMQLIASQYPQYERETWAIQLEQAKKYLETNNEDDAQFLKTLALAENDSVENFANAVIQKAAMYEQYSANALANKRAYQRELLAEIGL